MNMNGLARDKQCQVQCGGGSSILPGLSAVQPMGSGPFKAGRIALRAARLALIDTERGPLSLKSAEGNSGLRSFRRCSR